jgi:hypothetical protein
LQPNTIHFFICDGIVEQSRIHNDGPGPGYDPFDSKFVRVQTCKQVSQFFLNCGSGNLDKNVCSKKLQDRIKEINTTSNFKFKLNEFELETAGLQARFCFPDTAGTLDVLV